MFQMDLVDGIKRLSPENWLEHDQVRSFYKGIDQTGKPVPMTGNDWMGHILSPTLAEAVPLHIREMFEVARETLAYGFFFYPLYTLGVEQLFRVADAAAGAKCADLGIPIDLPKGRWQFKRRVDSLCSHGVIQPGDRLRWESHVELRNGTSHPKGQALLNPAAAIGMVLQIARDINSLFP